jgi:hypothetical protein
VRSKARLPCHSHQSWTCPPPCPPAPALQERYYNDKLHVASAAGRRRVVDSYIEGLHWVLEYYYRGVASWNWFYPYHYAPMASDLTNLDSIPGGRRSFLAAQRLRSWQGAGELPGLAWLGLAWRVSRLAGRAEEPRCTAVLGATPLQTSISRPLPPCPRPL